MKRLFAAALIAGVMLAGSFSTANAATVTPTNSVTFEFDVSSLGAFTIRAGQVDTGGNACWEVDCLNAGSTLQFDFGTTIGGNELGTAYYYNQFGLTPGAGGGIFAENPKSILPLKYFDIAASLDSIFVTVVYYDDVYFVGRLNLFDRSTGATVSLFGQELLAPVPLPTGAWLLLSALGGLGFMGWRKKHNAAA